MKALKIMAALGTLGALGYLLKDKITAAVDGILSKVDQMIEDQTPDPEPTPDEVPNGFKVGKRHEQ